MAGLKASGEHGGPLGLGCGWPPGVQGGHTVPHSHGRLPRLACTSLVTTAGSMSSLSGGLLLQGPLLGQVCPLDVAPGPGGSSSLVRQHQLLPFLALSSTPPPNVVGNQGRPEGTLAVWT